MNGPSTPAPTGRTRGYDLARAFAIIGMVFINFPIYLTSAADSAGSLLAWLSGIHYGRAAALFVTLAGAGVAMMARGAERGAVRRTLLLRAGFLFVAGHLLIQVWRIDILHFYAVYLALAALLFVGLPRRALLLAIALVMAVTVAVVIVAPELEAGGVAYYRLGEELTALERLAGLLQNVLFSGIHPVFPWIAFLLAGLWIGSHDIRDAGTRRRLLATGAALALGAPLVSMACEYLVMAGVLPQGLLAYLGVRHSPSPFYVLGAIGTSMAMIAACQAAAMHWGESVIVRAMIHAGQLAFTIYVVHAIFGAVIPVSLGLSLSLPAVLAYSAVFCLAVVTLAHLYRRHFRRGPVELLMRAVSGNSPPKVAAPDLRRLAAPRARWVPAAVAGLVLVVAAQVAGVPPRFGCEATPPLAAGRVQSALTLSCPRETFAVAVADRSDLVLETHSGRDLYLELYRGDELIGQNDDGGVGLNARLVATVDPGDYRLVVRPYATAVGPYALSRSDAAPTVAELQPGEMCTDSCPSSHDQECDDGGPGSLYAVCELGTDCADCGIRTEGDIAFVLDDNGMLCSDTCGSSHDSECDDGGPESLYAICALGTDCSDCGPREPNFTPMPEGE
ncbi:MAG: DUF418 domain-containing protein [Rhodospirillaceae bacterium]|nr:DUF418 domain-containing protein [Rhodospirillaceae bacterium]